MRGRPLWILWCLASLLSIAPVGADWLVMKDGTRVETRDAWQVKGSRVIFTLPNGTLSSLRLEEVDLDASAVATTAAEKEAEDGAEGEAKPAQRSEPEPVAVLTNKDIGRARPAPPAVAADQEGGGEGEGEGNESLPEAEPIDVQVVSWNDLDTINLQGVEIRGSVRNFGADLARELTLTVTLFDSVGEILAQAEAFLGKTLLQPSAATDFRALFPGVTSYSGEPAFQIRGRGPLYGEITGISDPRSLNSQEEESGS